MAVATALVIAITSAAPLLGPQLSGLLTTYPVYAGVLGVFAHAQRGGAAAAQVMRGLCYGIIAFATFFFAIGALVDRAGILPAFVAAATGAILVQALTLTRVRRAALSPTA
jgi:short subunit fatty acids transporter